jgi:hypothetical protein
MKHVQQLKLDQYQEYRDILSKKTKHALEISEESNSDIAVAKSCPNRTPQPIFNSFTISIDLGDEFHDWFPEDVQP